MSVDIPIEHSTDVFDFNNMFKSNLLWNNNKDNNNETKQFFKTRLCPWFKQGRCHRPSSCRFAHHSEELRPSKDLTKTSLCRVHYKTGGRCNDCSCRYAHSIKELRSTGHYYKSVVCKYWREGHCALGDICRYAHGDGDLVQHLERRPPASIEADNVSTALVRIMRKKTKKPIPHTHTHTHTE
eukprot:GHVR01150493.1.p1 GENE.GHVR01150493.1~~GHVR01150493.1.p1  ORF type:complete len:183 (+),score=48.77 GHVR01150493.1:44-592(+)